MARDKPFGPRAGCRAHVGLQLLAQIGPLNLVDWMNHAATSKAVGKFSREVAEPLKHWKLVSVARDGLHQITAVGKAFLEGREPDATEQPVATGRYVHPIQPLTARHRPPRPQRPGALDYQDIPSRYADVSVPFKSSIKPERE